MLESRQEERPLPGRGFGGRVVFVAKAAVVLFLAWKVAEGLLLTLLGILFGILLAGLAERAGRWTRLPRPGALGLVLVLLVGGVVAFGWFAVPRLATQVENLSEELPLAADALRERLAARGWGEYVLQVLPDADSVSTEAVVARLTTAASITVSIVSAMLYIAFLGIFLAASPDTYRAGLLRIARPGLRERVGLVLDDLGSDLWGWLFVRGVSMLVVGVLTYAGLRLLGIELALVLGVLAALLTFIPFLGPLLSAAPAVLLGFAQSESQGLYVLLLYGGVQLVESYLLLPMVLQHEVSLPPALTLFSLVVLTGLFGFLGALVATPLALIVRTTARHYLEERDSTDVLRPSAPPPRAPLERARDPAVRTTGSGTAAR